MQFTTRSISKKLSKNLAQKADAVDTYFECITSCSIDDGECITQCVEKLKDAEIR